MEYLILSPFPTAVPTATTPYVDIPASPLANGSGIRRMIEFVESLSGMQCGTIEEWETFVEEQFEDESRFHLTLTGQDLKMYDIPTAFLPRFFVTLQECGLETHNLVLLDPIESRISTSSPGGSGLSLLVECEEIEWRTDHQTTWKGSLIAEIGSSSSSSSTDKIDNLEMEFDCSEYEIPDRVLRVLEMSQQMENMMLVMEVAEEEKLSPSEALESLVERSSDTQTP
ncbi:hypothetical protein CI109_101404 [Kwoniella shandongensis]|uniref:Uncharacterized protein n=1 Tax=Kwoniella shandongensis TaxID=1734106 RepID=A0A5M6BUK7_9TREE|nr:uncharacterized protein CI109_005101 [Kwoniella shandongensis]KAA5526527.1 hypothetical protein CI109_005101 [Kwoniella shandongensis]